ncbi:MAG: hypothetical protein GX541_06195 [Clostridiales bacterium]|jgi:hypothetical protein|nr:hypothetical protein [Clostridiales bacterium]
MNVKQLAEALKLKTYNAGAQDREVAGCYIGDLLSRVMSRADRGDLWITIMPNINVAAVAVLSEVSCVVLAEDVTPDAELLEKCVKENVALYGSVLSAYALACEINKVI